MSQSSVQTETSVIEQDKVLTKQIIERLLIGYPPNQKVRVHLNQIRDCARVLEPGQWESEKEGAIRAKRALVNLKLWSSKTDGRGAYVRISKDILEGREKIECPLMECPACGNKVPEVDFYEHVHSCWIGFVCKCERIFPNHDELYNHQELAEHSRNYVRPKEVRCADCHKSYPGYKANGEIYVKEHQCVDVMNEQVKPAT